MLDYLGYSLLFFTFVNFPRREKENLFLKDKISNFAATKATLESQMSVCLIAMGVNLSLHIFEEILQKIE